MRRAAFHPAGISIIAGDEHDRGARRALVVTDHRARSSTRVLDDGRDVDASFAADGRAFLVTVPGQPSVQRRVVASPTAAHAFALPRPAGALIADKRGKRALYLGDKRGLYLADLQSGREKKLEHCNEHLGFATRSASGDRVVVPMSRKGCITLVHFPSLSADVIHLRIDAVIRWAGFVGKSAIMCAAIDAKRRAHLIDVVSGRALWTTAIDRRDHVGVGACAADGSLIGVVVSRANSNDVVVLSARTGAIVATYVDAGACDGFPYRDTRIVLDEEAVRGKGERARTFDLATGRVRAETLKGP